MRRTRRTPAADALTGLILEVFRLNGRLLAAGDALVADLGMTAARWQVLGAAALAERPEPVANLARSMGLSRQGVQRIVDELAADGTVAFRENPHHRRARLVILTPRGRELYNAIDALQARWASALAEGLAPTRLRVAAAALKALRTRLEGGA